MTAKEAIDLLHSRLDLIEKDYPDIADYAEALLMVIEALSAHPEKHTDKRTETRACDLISRAMLLEYIHNEPVGKMLCDKYNLDGVIKQLPSAQPDVPDTNVGDMIYRQQAIDAIGNVPDHDDVMVWEALFHAQRDVALLPSAHPEIIRCGQCKYAEVADSEDSQDGYTCQFHRGSIWFSGSYCSWAERRQYEL